MTASLSSRNWTRLGLFAGLVLSIWLIGLALFTQRVTTIVPADHQKTDAIVALTGELSRLREGVALLKARQSDRLFISGVYRGLHVEELMRVMREDVSDFECCIDIGYVAANTHGNATETAEWVEAQSVSSLRLITSNYHMPRSLLEFRRTMPDVVILPHPVPSELLKFEPWYAGIASVKLLAIEFSKYLFVLISG